MGPLKTHEHIHSMNHEKCVSLALYEELSRWLASRAPRRCACQVCLQTSNPFNETTACSPRNLVFITLSFLLYKIYRELAILTLSEPGANQVP